MAESPSRPSPRSGSSSSTAANPPSLSLLRPPATIVSPPTPIDPTHSIPSFSSPTTLSPTSDNSPEILAYDSPDEDVTVDDPNDISNTTLSPVTSRTRPGRHGPIAAKALSTSPSREPSLLTPGSPNASHTSLPVSPRSASPSSPHYHARPSHHRRTSSTHRVKETIGGEQKSTEDGALMVNQYRIGESLGSGAYAKVELGVDVGTGIEYAIKEFSKSRLKLQALQEKQRQAARGRGRRPPGPGQRRQPQPVTENDDGSSGRVDQPQGGSGPWGNAGTTTIEDDPLGLIRREIAIMKKLDHPNIVHLYESISMPNADALFLVLEYMPGGVLLNVEMGAGAEHAKPPFELSQTREYFRQLCLGLEYLHANGVVHRDIKPDNVLLSKDKTTVKLCDFGVSEMFDAKDGDVIKRSGGSPAFLSPESFTSAAEVHGTAVDVWALGVTLYCMLTGRLPFNVENPIELFEQVKTADPPLHEDWSEHLKDLLSSMFQKNPANRATIAKIREHDWVTEEGSHPMIPTEDNLYYVGKHVEEPTQDELRCAVCSMRSIFTVVRAVQKMRRLWLTRRSESGSSTAPDSPHVQPSSPTTSTSQSLTSGSMDSYASLAPNESVSSDELDEKWKEQISGQEVLSPASMDSDEVSTGKTERRGSQNPFDKLKSVITDRLPGSPATEMGDSGETVVFASPTSEGSTPVSPAADTSLFGRS